MMAAPVFDCRVTHFSHKPWSRSPDRSELWKQNDDQFNNALNPSEWGNDKKLLRYKPKEVGQYFFLINITCIAIS